MPATWVPRHSCRRVSDVLSLLGPRSKGFSRCLLVGIQARNEQRRFRGGSKPCDSFGSGAQARRAATNRGKNKRRNPSRSTFLMHTNNDCYTGGLPTSMRECMRSGCKGSTRNCAILCFDCWAEVPEIFRKAVYAAQDEHGPKSAQYRDALLEAVASLRKIIREEAT